MHQGLPTDICIVKLDGGNHLNMNVHSGRNEIDYAKPQVEGPTDLKFCVENAPVLTESSLFYTLNSLSSAPDTIYRGQLMACISGRY